MSELFNRREKAYFYASAYLSALFVSIVILWGIVLLGSNPLTFKSVQLVDQFGQATQVLHVGESVGVRREVCSDKVVGIEFYPSLRDKDGMLFPLPSGMVEAAIGCGERTYGFIVPDIPAGEYRYSSTIRYQTNLVGRDEVVVSPAIEVRIEK